MVKVSIFNYGVGNLYSLRVALDRIGAQPSITSSMRSCRDSDAILLPGVGNFSDVTKRLPLHAISDWIDEGKPLLGICLGMQLLFKHSEEGEGKGIGLLPGKVKRFPSTVKIPQIGWNVVRKRKDSVLLDGAPNTPWVYYVHSYYPDTEGPWVTATSEYGLEYPCMIESKNVFGVQFHPEKSGTTGRVILENFLRMLKK